MRKLVLLIFLTIIVFGFYVFSVIKNQVRTDFRQTVTLPKLTQAPTLSVNLQKDTTVTTSVFVPYWTINQSTNITSYSSYVYFGVVPGSNGINFTENGAVDLKTFLSSVPEGSNKLLTLRMIDNNQNFSILSNTTLQKNIINDTITMAQQNQFNGIVLDLEISAIPFDTLEKQIDDFNALFYKTAKANGLTFQQTLYGDTFFRLRPFDVQTLAKNTDGMMIMAYDFSKANGNPGPNFPLLGKDAYGYDLTKMSDDFLQFVPNNKLTVVFGMFGYDWPVDNNGDAISQGMPLTDQEIQKQFLNGCAFSPCVITKDPVSSETQIHYTDKNNQKHIVWFEDMNSLNSKEKYLKTRGINSFSYWAYSYF